MLEVKLIHISKSGPWGGGWLILCINDLIAVRDLDKMTIFYFCILIENSSLPLVLQVLTLLLGFQYIQLIA